MGLSDLTLPFRAERTAALLLACHIALQGCSGSGQDDDLGPIAAIDTDVDDSMEAGIEGTLKVTRDCVFLSNSGEETLLVFRQPEVSWDGAAREVLFSSGGTTVRLGDGQPVVFGGGGSSQDEDGLDNDSYLRETEWANAPDPSCVRPNRFEVHSVVQPR